VKRIVLAFLQLAFLPFLTAYVIGRAAFGTRRHDVLFPPRRIALVTPFGAGTKSGSARAVGDLLEMLTTDFHVTVIALRELHPRPGLLGHIVGRVLGSALPMEEKLRDFMTDPNPVVSRLIDADLVFVEFVYGALFLFRPVRIKSPLVLRDHEVLARRYATEFSAARGLSNKFIAAARLCIVWMVTLHLYFQAYRIIALTPEDAEWLRRWFPFVRGRVVAIPVSFRVTPLQAADGPARSRHILYAANFYHKPNVDGLLWFLAECAPALERDVTLHLLGLDDPLERTRLPETALTIVRHGHVEDIEAVCSDIPIALAPMISGGGIRVKNLLFGSLAKAIVTTGLANEGIGFKHGNEAMVCDRPEEFAAAVNQLIARPAYAKFLGVNARSAVETRFSHDAIRARYASEVFSPLAS
jgi:glycosyltransferase involved in cell wall biosynthesis